MSGVSGYKYNVIQFLEVPYEGIANVVCVPRSWVKSFGAGAHIANVSYPVEEPSLTEERVKNGKKKSDSWKSFLAVVRYSTGNYENAKFYIQQEITNSEKNKGDFHVDANNIQDATNKSEKNYGDHTLLSAKANEQTSISTQNATSRATIDNDTFVEGMIDALRRKVSSKSEEKPCRSAQFATRSAKINIMAALGLNPMSNNNNKSTNTTKTKRKALPDPDKENHKKLCRVNEPDESDNQVAGPSNEALDWSSKNHLFPTPEDSNEHLCTQETPVEKFNANSTEMRKTVNQNLSKTNNSLDPKIIAQLATSPTFVKFCMLIQELQEVFDNPMFKELINKLLNMDKVCSAPQNNDNIAFAPSNTTMEAPKLNKEQSNVKPLEEKDTDDDDDDDKDQSLKQKSCPKRIEDVVLPPVNDTSHSEESDFDEDENISPVNDGSHSEESDFDDDDDGDYQPIKKKSCPKQIKKVVLPPVNDKKDSEERDFDEDENLSPPNDASLSEERDFDKDENLHPVNDANPSEESDFDFDFDDDDDDDGQPLRKLPREYDANNSRWTLNYCKTVYPAHVGLFELMPQSAVYVSPYLMTTFKRFSGYRRSKALVEILVSAVFTSTAVKFCSLPGTRAKAIDRDGANIRPALDKHAIKVIINYVTDHLKKEGLPSMDTRSIIKIMRDEMKFIKKHGLYRI